MKTLLLIVAAMLVAIAFQAQAGEKPKPQQKAPTRMSLEAQVAASDARAKAVCPKAFEPGTQLNSAFRDVAFHFDQTKPGWRNQGNFPEQVVDLIMHYSPRPEWHTARIASEEAKQAPKLTAKQKAAASAQRAAQASYADAIAGGKLQEQRAQEAAQREAELTSQWIADAIDRYPALGVKDSPINKAFLRLYDQTKRTAPESLRESHWPLRLAISAASSLSPDTTPPPTQIAASSAISSSPPLSSNEPQKPSAPPPSPVASAIPSSPSTVAAATESGYTPRLSPDDLITIHNAGRDMSLQQSRVHVDGYVRGNSQVSPYDRQPPGGITFDDKLKAEGQGIAFALGAIVVDYGLQKLDEWWKKHERDKQEQTSK